MSERTQLLVAFFVVIPLLFIVYAIFRTYQEFAVAVAVFAPVIAGVVFGIVKFVKWAWYK